MEAFKPQKPMRFPLADGSVVSQIDLYRVLTDPGLDIGLVARVVEPVIKGAQERAGEQSQVPEIALYA